MVVSRGGCVWGSVYGRLHVHDVRRFWDQAHTGMGSRVLEDIVCGLEEFFFEFGIAEFLGDIVDEIRSVEEIEEDHPICQALFISGFDDEAEIFACGEDIDAVDGGSF